MNLKVYLAEKQLSVKNFAKIVGVHPNYISRIIPGKVTPSARLARDIEQETGGKVKITSFEKSPINEQPIPTIYEDFDF